MKLQDFGSFIVKRKDNSIWTIIYFKTNYLLKKHPNYKLTTLDEKTKKFKVKNHSPNKAWFAVFDKHGRDGISLKDSTYKETEQFIKKDSQEIYNYSDYTNSLDLYIKMKESGLNKFYTKKWVESNYNFIKSQLDKL